MLSPQQSTHSLQWINQSTIRSNFLLSLGSEYDSLVISVHQRVAPPSIDELYGHLLSHELRLEQQTSTPNLSLAGANVAVKSNFFRGGRGNGGRSSNFSNSGFGNSIAGNKKSFPQSPNKAGGVGVGLQVGPSSYVKLYWPSTIITGLTIPIIVNSLLLCKPTTTLILLSRIPIGILTLALLII